MGKEHAFSRWEEERAFSRISPADKADIEKIDNHLKFAEWIDDPKKEQLGRAVVLQYPPDPDDDESEMTYYTAGRAFPLADDDSKHLVVFKNRRMVIVEPLPPRDASAEAKRERLKNHKSLYAFKPTELLFRMDDKHLDIDEQIGTVIEYMWEDSQLKMSNDPHDELPTFKTDVIVNRAMVVAKRLKERRENKFNKDIWVMMDEYEKQFGNPRKDQPPAIEPPAA